ncbi:MAG: hypothetical protein EXX96DRAFT_456876, partial [Benjaminiella poitrasii]
KLRYKDHDRKEHYHHKHKSKEKRHKKEKPYKPPTLYEEEEGWVPPSVSHKDEDEAWRAHLFDAMIDDEGQDPFYSNYEEHVGRSNQPAAMSDEEYRQYIVDGMYRRKHADEIAAKEKRQAAREKKRIEKEKARQEQERQEAERIRLENVYRQLEKVKKNETARIEYNDKWNKLEDKNSVLYKKDIPWPIIGKDFSLESVKTFIIDPKFSPEENKKSVRKEQTRYHPDKFITRYMKRFEGSEKEKERILTRINEISGWLNEIWSQM